VAELVQQERLQPSLLDRLTDDEPTRPAESREQRVLSMSRLRESVLRDVGWLFNSVQLAATEDLDAYPEVARSVLNFGVPALAGVHVVGRDLQSLEVAIAEAIQRFEPRILPDSMVVKVAMRADDVSRRAMTFTIEGLLWAQPVPQSLFLKTELDLETGAVRVADTGR
jgi:type VI secretion system protein ImpF